MTASNGVGSLETPAPGSRKRESAIPIAAAKVRGTVGANWANAGFMDAEAPYGSVIVAAAERPDWPDLRELGTIA